VLHVLRVATIETDLVFFAVVVARERNLAHGWLMGFALFNATETQMNTPTLLSQRKIQSISAIVILIAAAARADDSPIMSHVDAVLNMEFANEYVTPRGMIVTDRGLTFQPLLLGLVNVYKGTGFLNDVTLVPGIWSDFCSSQLSKTGPTVTTPPTTEWIEIDPIAGISFTAEKRFKLDVTWTEFNMQVLNISTSQHLDSKLTFDDSDFLKAFALHPYFEFWQELRNKATDADLPASIGLAPRPGAQDPEPGSSYYFDIGIDPGYTFKDFHNVKVETPCRVMLPNERFYGDFYAPSSTVGLFELGLKFSVPMSFMPAGMVIGAFTRGSST
jgi:hypothetical protein